eukprot:7094416-Prymnesium_polylepis.2
MFARGRRGGASAVVGTAQAGPAAMAKPLVALAYRACRTLVVRVPVGLAAARVASRGRVQLVLEFGVSVVVWRGVNNVATWHFFPRKPL